MIKKLAIAGLVAVLGATSAHAVPASLGGLGLEKTWVDNEGITDEMPDFVWGSASTNNADKFGLFVEFADGTTGSIVYSGVSGKWGTTGPVIGTVELATGFFAPYAAAGLHFLNNTDSSGTLPIAWASNPATAFGSNVELDYHDTASGSQFRIQSAGWQSVEFATYSSTAVSAVPLPAGAALLFSGLVAFGGIGAFRRRRAA